MVPCDLPPLPSPPPLVMHCLLRHLLLWPPPNSPLPPQPPSPGSRSTYSMSASSLAMLMPWSPTNVVAPRITGWSFFDSTGISINYLLPLKNHQPSPMPTIKNPTSLPQHCLSPLSFKGSKEKPKILEPAPFKFQHDGNRENWKFGFWSGAWCSLILACPALMGQAQHETAPYENSSVWAVGLWPAGLCKPTQSDSSRSTLNRLNWLNRSRA